MAVESAYSIFSYQEPSSRSQWPRSVKEWVCGRSLAGNLGSNPADGMDICLLGVLCVLSGRGLCDGPISRPEWCEGSVVMIATLTSSRYKRSRLKQNERKQNRTKTLGYTAPMKFSKLTELSCFEILLTFLLRKCRSIGLDSVCNLFQLR